MRICLHSGTPVNSLLSLLPEPAPNEKPMPAALPEQDEAPQAVDLACTQEEIMQLRTIAESRTCGIWKSKRARAILGRLEEKTIGSLVSEVRVPPESIIRCLQEFSSERINYFDNHVRQPTSREAPIEKILLFLEHSPEKEAKEWDRLLPKKRVDPDDVAVLQFEVPERGTFASSLWYEAMDTYHYIGGKGLFVQDDLFHGTCYKAANWKFLGVTGSIQDMIASEVSL